jgi:hypothetical protein
MEIENEIKQSLAKYNKPLGEAAQARLDAVVALTEKFDMSKAASSKAIAQTNAVLRDCGLVAVKSITNQ